jgi:hypothetical protein
VAVRAGLMGGFLYPWLTLGTLWVPRCHLRQNSGSVLYPWVEDTPLLAGGNGYPITHDEVYPC